MSIQTPTPPHPPLVASEQGGGSKHPSAPARTFEDIRQEWEAEREAARAPHDLALDFLAGVLLAITFAGGAVIALAAFGG